MLAMDQILLDHIEKIVTTDGRYAAGAYSFVMEALGYTQKRFRRERHVTGEELLTGVRELAVRKFGPLAATVLRHWGIKTSEDVGCVVFNLVDYGILGKQEEDSMDSFRSGVDFEEMFRTYYRRQLDVAVRRLR
jgi:uncharacterized repeat protein (TIGR04138 family)